MMKPRVFLFAPLLLVASVSTPVLAETDSCTAIPSIPYNIRVSGAYCLTQSLRTPATMNSGSAVTVSVDNVVLDLKGFSIRSGTGKRNEAVGISATDRSYVTVRNGRVSGFARGIVVAETAAYSQGCTIENILVGQSTQTGMRIEGRYQTIRDNRVVATGGAVGAGTDVEAKGLIVAATRSQVLNNLVAQVASQGSGMAAGICVKNGANVVVSGNSVTSVTSPSGPSYGIHAMDSSDVLMRDNNISSVAYGISYTQTSTGKYMNNLTQAVPTPYEGGTAAGPNY